MHLLRRKAACAVVARLTGVSWLGGVVAVGLLWPAWDAPTTTAQDVAGHPLLVMNADGTGLRQLVALSPFAFHGSPTWSHDGKKIAFDAWTGDRNNYGESHVFVMDADGRSPRDLGPGAMPSWSGDDKQFVFHQYGGKSGIWMMNIDGSGRTRLTKGGISPSWSPAANRIAYLNGSSVWLIDLSEPRSPFALHQNRSQIWQGIDWSHDGKRISFLRERPLAGQFPRQDPADFRELVILDVKDRRATAKVRWRGPMYHQTGWSPDGKWIVFAMKGDGDRYYKLHVVDPDGDRPPRRLEGQPEGRNVFAAWSMDSKKVIFASGDQR